MKCARLKLGEKNSGEKLLQKVYLVCQTRYTYVHTVAV